MCVCGGGGGLFFPEEWLYVCQMFKIKFVALFTVYVWQVWVVAWISVSKVDLTPRVILLAVFVWYWFSWAEFPTVLI